MSLDHPVGAIAVALGILCFFGSIYVVVALNVGWRFGYWVSSASFGALMLFISLFWILTGLGPAGEEANWVPVASGAEEVDTAEFGGTTYESPAEYPDDPWEPASESEAVGPEEGEALTSSFQNCLTAEVDTFGEEMRETCEQAQSLLPAEDDLPKVEGMAVTMQPRFEDVAITTEGGTILAEAVAVPVTLDPRVADDPEVGVPVGDPILMVAYFDPGSLRVPALFSLILFGLYFAFHMWGLHRAEQQKLSAVAA